MNLQVSYNWLKEYLPGLKATPEEVAEKLSLHSFSVERLKKMAEGLDGVVVGEILEFHKHPNADKLSVAKVDIGREKPIQLIFGQMVTMHVGDKVPVAIAPTTLPGGRKIERAKMRGEESQGMLCLDQELGFLETGVSIRYFDKSMKNGTPVAVALELDDTVFEVELTTNRPDAMGMVGLAREVGAILGIEPKIQSLKLKSSPKQKIQKSLDLKVEVPKLCSRYIAVVMEGVKVGPSPWWMQRKLISSGIRPINNLVDITNYVLLEWGQPCHVFDYDKLTSPIIVRAGRKGEKILALDGNTYELDENILVIADAVRPVAIAGIMGGQDSGVQEAATRIVFEIANFDPVIVRKGEHQLALSSDSSALFNKGLPVQLPEFAAAKLIALAQEIGGGEVVQVIDKSAQKPKSLRVAINPGDIIKKIGIEIPVTQMKEYLTRLGFKVSGTGKRWQITFPFWRFLEADGVADIAEEVARMYGYHKLPSVLPEGTLPSNLPDQDLVKAHTLKEVLRGAGFTEVYTYSLISEEDIRKANFNPQSDALRLTNPLSSEMTHLRPWLGISMLSAVEKNENLGRSLKLFEVSAEYHPRGGNQSELPEEREKLIAACAGPEEWEGEHFFSVKGIAEHLAKTLGLPALSFEKVGKTEKAPWVSRYHPVRVLICKANHDIIGVVGELHPQLLKAYGIEHRIAFLEWEVKALLAHVGSGRTYHAPAPFPAVKRDISFVVPKTVEYAEIVRTMKSVDVLLADVEFFDQYEGKGVPEEYRSLAFHLAYSSPERTLTSEEAEKAHTKLIKMLEKQFGVKIRE